MNWCVQIDWNGTWITVDQGYKTKDDAKWATAQWKQKNQCLGDPFRATPIDGVALVNVVADTRPPADVLPTFHKGDRLVVSSFDAVIAGIFEEGRVYVAVADSFTDADGDEFVQTEGDMEGGGWYVWRFKKAPDVLPTDRDALRAKMLNPLYIPSLPEALADPAGFVEGMQEIGGEG